MCFPLLSFPFLSFPFLSAWQARVSAHGGSVVMDEMKAALWALLNGLAVPFTVPGGGSDGGVVFEPVIHLSVLAQTAPLSQVRSGARRHHGP